MPTDGTRTRLRRVGWTGPLIELLPPVAALAYLLWADIGQPMYLFAAGVWLVVVLVQILVSRIGQLVVDDETLRHESRLGRIGELVGLDWELPLDELRVELIIGDGGLPYFRPWQVNAVLIVPGEEPRTLTRLLDWCRVHVPTDPMNRSRLSERVRAAGSEPLDALRQYPLIRLLEEQEVRVEMATAENLTEAVQESRKRRRERLAAAGEKRESLETDSGGEVGHKARAEALGEVGTKAESPAQRQEREKHEHNLSSHAGPMTVVTFMALAAVYALTDSLMFLDEGLASWHGLGWMPLVGLVVVLPLAVPVVRSGYHGASGLGLLLVAWLVLSVCSYPLVIRSAQALGEEPRMVDYVVKEVGLLEAQEEGWPDVHRFRRHDKYWQSMPDDAVYPLEMRRAPGGIYLVNVSRVLLSQQQFLRRNNGSGEGE